MITNKAPKILDNKGLQALTVPEERNEINVVVSLDKRLKEAAKKGRKVIFAFFQSDFKGGRIPYWHVALKNHPSFGSTLSMEGLCAWNVI